MVRRWVYAGTAIILLALVYFVWRPVLVNQESERGAAKITVTEFGFCHQFFELRTTLHSRLVPSMKGAAVEDRKQLSTDKKSCVDREGELFGFWLPHRAAYLDSGPGGQE